MNYYDRLKDLYYIDYKYDSANLFNDNFKFMLKTFGYRLLILALFLTIISLLPLTIGGNSQAILENGVMGSINLIDTPNMADNITNIISSLMVTIASTLILSFFIMTYFFRAREMKLSWAKSMSIFKSGILKLIGIMLIGMSIAFFLSIALFMLLFLGRFAFLLYTMGIMLLLIFVQTFQVSIFDDGRVKFSLVYERTMEVIRNKGFKFKFLFIMVLNLLVPWTMDSIVQLLPEEGKIAGLLIASYLNTLFSLFMLGFLITVFIFYSEHVKFYLNPEAARDYGYNPVENREVELDHE